MKSQIDYNKGNNFGKRVFDRVYGSSLLNLGSFIVDFLDAEISLDEVDIDLEKVEPLILTQIKSYYRESPDVIRKYEKALEEFKRK